MELVPARELPESAKYVDAGCSYHPACLTCPFDVCRLDVRSGRPSFVPIAALYAERQAGFRRDELAKKYGVSARQISRLTAKARATEATGASDE